MKKFLLLILFSILLFKLNKNEIDCLPLPSNKYLYMLARNLLKQIETSNSSYGAGGSDSDTPLNPKEKVVNLYFEKFKLDELKNTTSKYYSSRPLENELNDIINRPLYGLLKNLPKGGNLHVHEPEMLDRRLLLTIIQNSNEYNYLYICDKSTDPNCAKQTCNCTDNYLKYFVNTAPPGWTKVKGSNWTIDSILNKTTLIGLLNNLEQKIYPTDSASRWSLALDSGDFSFYQDLISFNKTRFDYMRACLDTSLNENVQLVEFRRDNFGYLYYFDLMTGNRIIINASSELQMLNRFKLDYIETNPKFIDFVFIIYGSRGKSKSKIEQDVSLTIETQKQFGDLIRGYDLVGEEDRGHTLLFHSDSLIGAFDYMNANSSSPSSFGFYFHTAETSWPNDYLPTNFGDDESTLNNLYDSILLHTRRIGHGLGLIKHPKLYPFLIEQQIAIEVCPASNQILGYVPDLRNHPAINYYRSGLPIVLGGDDPGSFGYNELTVDYYLAYTAWGLNLADLREIANNSIRYSSISDEKKQIGFDKFNKVWNEFIDTFYDVACKNRFDTRPNISDLLPPFGPNDRVNTVSLFGYGFEYAICQNVSILYDDVEASCQLSSLYEIKCDTPLGFESNRTVTIRIKIGNDPILPTQFNYTFYSISQLFGSPVSSAAGSSYSDNNANDNENDNDYQLINLLESFQFELIKFYNQQINFGVYIFILNFCLLCFLIVFLFYFFFTLNQSIRIN